jgi:hypothetical protein
VTEPLVHRFAAESYEALTPDTPSLCGDVTVKDMDFDPRSDPEPFVRCERCEQLAVVWTEFYQPGGAA